MQIPVIVSHTLTLSYKRVFLVLKAILFTTFTFVLPAAAQDMVIVAFGDSLTQGYGLPEQDGFVPQLQGWLEAQGESVQVINAGVSGDTSSGGLARVGWVLSGDVDAVILELGANDMLRGVPTSVTRENMDNIMAQISAMKLPVLVVGMKAPPNFGADYQSEFDAIYPDLAANYNAEYYPFMFKALESVPRAEALATLMQADASHPNAAGVTLIVNDIGPYVQGLIARIE